MTDAPLAEPAGYPAELSEHAYLDDGTPVEFRAVRPDDKDRFERLFYRLSPQSLYLRFFAPVARPKPALLQRLTNVDYRDRLALVALIDDEVVGVARYDRLAPQVPAGLTIDPGEAEAAVIVEDAWQGHGIATRLLWRLSSAAVARGVTTFTGTILADNRRMVGLLPALGEDVQMELSGGEYTVRLRLPSVSPPPAEPTAAGGSGRR